MEATLNKVELTTKKDFDMCMKRINAWYKGEILDRPPVRFTRINNNSNDELKKDWTNLKERWYDEDYQIDSFIKSIENRNFNGETFPIFCPNLGPNVLAGYYGSSISFGETTTWSEPCVEDLEELQEFPKLDYNNEYFIKIENLTRKALEKSKGRFLVGYTDLHPGLDLLDAMRGTENLCMDLYDDPEKIQEWLDVCDDDFQKVFNYYHEILSSHNQPSVGWLGIPSYGKMHIPSCDFSAMISNDLFEEFYLSLLKKEVKPMDHNIFHLDGKDVAKHLDMILEIPEIQAIQWAQGVGEDKPIMQWISLIKKIQDAGKGVVLDIQQDELEDFIKVMDPKGLYLCFITESDEEEVELLKRVERW